MAHELAHVQNRDILVGTIAATFAGAISMIGNMLQWGAMLGAGRGDDEEGPAASSVPWSWRSSPRSPPC